MTSLSELFLAMHKDFLDSLKSPAPFALGGICGMIGHYYMGDVIPVSLREQALQFIRQNRPVCTSHRVGYWWPRPNFRKRAAFCYAMYKLALAVEGRA